MEVLLQRLKKQPNAAKETLGDITVLGENGSVVYKCKTMELPWRNNEQRQSCIPTGSYTVVKRNSAKYGQHFHITGVPDRDLILIHNCNYVTQLLGCVGVGKAHADINGDGLLDVTSSVVTLKELVKLLPKTFTITIS